MATLPAFVWPRPSPETREVPLERMISPVKSSTPENLNVPPPVRRSFVVGISPASCPERVSVVPVATSHVWSTSTPIGAETV